jgi:Cu/Ag efflux pump CusA
MQMTSGAAESVTKTAATIITTAGASTSMVSGLWLVQHKDLVAIMVGLGGLAIAFIGMVAGIAIQIYWHKKRYDLALQQHRRVDD